MTDVQRFSQYDVEEKFSNRHQRSKLHQDVFFISPVVIRGNMV